MGEQSNTGPAHMGHVPVAGNRCKHDMKRSVRQCCVPGIQRRRGRERGGAALGEEVRKGC